MKSPTAFRADVKEETGVKYRAIPWVEMTQDDFDSMGKWIISTRKNMMVVSTWWDIVNGEMIYDPDAFFRVHIVPEK